jgi:hypothetical protein
MPDFKQIDAHKRALRRNSNHQQNYSEEKIEVGTVKHQFLGSKEPKNSDLKFHILGNKRLPTITKKRLFIISFSNPGILALHLS